MSKDLVHSAKPVKSLEDHDGSKKLGFWIYLMTDCVLFATLFATYVVLRNNTNGGASAHMLFDLPFVLAETLLLLTSSFVCGLAVIAARQKSTRFVIGSLAVTYLLGTAFLTLELSEFISLASDGHGWWTSAFLSGFFTLVGTHGLHIAVGLLWVIVMAWQILNKGFTPGTLRRLGMFSMFWHFLDIVWIFIFTIVYLMGGM